MIKWTCAKCGKQYRENKKVGIIHYRTVKSPTVLFPHREVLEEVVTCIHCYNEKEDV